MLLEPGRHHQGQRQGRRRRRLRDQGRALHRRLRRGAAPRPASSTDPTAYAPAYTERVTPAPRGLSARRRRGAGRAGRADRDRRATATEENGERHRPTPAAGAARDLYKSFGAGPGAARRGLRRPRRRGDRARRRQRRRQVHPGQVHQRHLLARLGRVPLRRQAGHHPQPARRRRARHRGRLPGPRALRQPRHRPEHVPRPGAPAASVLDEPTMEQMAAETLAGLAVRTVKSVRQQVASLSGGQRQTVAIAKAVLWNSKVVILDEPTAALGVAQTAQVLELVRRLADNGLAVVLISHNMNDVFAVSDRIAALYLGRMVAQVKATDVTHAQVVELITAGRSGNLGLPAPPRPTAGRRRERSRRHDHRYAPRPRPRRSTPPPVCRRHVSDYWRRVAAASMGALPAVLGLVVLCTVFAIVATGVPHRRQLREPAAPGRRGHRHRDGPGLRAAARRDRPLGRLHQRRLRRGPGDRCSTELRLCPGTSRSWPRVVTGMVIGLVLGILVAKVGIPSFVVTLAAFLAFQGVVLHAHQGRHHRLRSATRSSWRSATRTCRPWLGWVLLRASAIGALRGGAAQPACAAAPRRGLTHDPLQPGAAAGRRARRRSPASPSTC